MVTNSKSKLLALVGISFSDGILNERERKDLRIRSFSSTFYLYSYNSYFGSSNFVYYIYITYKN